MGIQQVSVKTRVILSALYFLQYMALPVWFITLVPYAKSMGAQGSTLALIVSSMAIGSLSAPFVGMVTDRFFAAQKVMAVLNVLSAVGLVLAGMQTSVLPLIVCLTLTMIVYMPTWSTINYIIFSHCPKNIFLQIRVFAVIGWIAAAAFSVVGLDRRKSQRYAADVFLRRWHGLGCGGISAVCAKHIAKGARSAHQGY